MAETITDNTTPIEPEKVPPEILIGEENISIEDETGLAINTPDLDAIEEKIESDNKTLPEKVSPETPAPDNITIEKTFKEYPQEFVALQGSKWLKGYSEKTGIFDSEEGVLKGKSAKEVIQYIQEKEDKNNEVNSLTAFLKKEFGIISEREEWDFLDWTIYNTGDQIKGLNYAAYLTVQGDKWLPFPPTIPQTGGGEVAAYAGQAGFSYGAGAILNAPKWLGKAIPALESFVALPASKAVIQMATGEAITLPKEWRLSTIMRDTFDMDKGVFDWLAASEDEGMFEGRFKSFLDGFFVGMGGTILVPPLLYFGKQLFKGGSFVKNAVVNTKPIKALTAELKQIKNDYIDLFPETIVKTRDVDIAKTIPKLRKELQEQIALKTGKKKPKPEVEPIDFTPTLHSDETLLPFTHDTANFRFENPGVTSIPKDKLPKEAFVTERQLNIKNISSEKVKNKLKANRDIPDGTVVEVRPTIAPADALNTRKGKQVLVTVHPDPKNAKKPKSPIGYDRAVTLRNVEFRVNQDARYEIASGKSTKFPAMTAKGEIVQVKPVFEGVEVNFNPKSDHLFRVVENGLAIRSAEEAVIVDQRVLVRGKITYWDKKSAPKAKHGKKSGTKFKYNDRKKELITDTDTVIASKAGAETLSPQEVEEFITGPIDTTKKLGRINLEKIIADHDVIRAIEVMGEKLPKHIPMSEEQARRGADLWIEELKLKGVDIETFLAQLGGKTKDLPYQILAARILHANQTQKFAEAARLLTGKALTTRIIKEELRKARNKGRNTEVLEERLALEGATLDDALDVLEETAKFHQLTGFLSGVNTDIARAQRFQQIPVMPEMVDPQVITDITEKALRRLETAAGTGQEAQEIIEDFAIMVTQHTDDAQISNMVNKPFFTRLFEAINFVNINAMLSNVATNSVNITGTGVMTNIIAGEKILGAIYSKLPGMGGGGTQGGFKESYHYIFGMSQALLESVWFTESKMLIRSAGGLGWKTFKRGKLDKVEHELHRAGLSVGEETLGGFGVPEALGPRAIGDLTGLNIPDQSVIGRILKTASIGVGLPGRGLLAGDAFFKETNYRAFIHMLSWREATNLAGANATHSEIKATYRELIRALPEEIDEAAQIASQIALFHEKLEPKGLETLFHWLEKNRKATISPGVKNFLLKNFGSNVATSFLLSKMPFVKTLYNIQKQMMWERGPVKLARLGYSFLSDEKAAKAWAKNPHQRQQDLAQITTGMGLMYLGYAGYKGLTIDENQVQLNLNSPDINTRDLNQEDFRLVPDVTIRNIQDGTLHSIPIGRADPITSPVIAGAMIALYEELWLEMEALEEAGETFEVDEKSEELMRQIFYQTGMFFTDKMALQGLKDIIFSVPGLDHPYSDPSKIINDYLVEWLNPVFYESLRKGIARAVQNRAFLPQAKIKERLVPKEKGDKGVLDRHGNLLSANKIEQLGYITKLVNSWIDRQRKLYIIDPDGDLDEEGKNDPIKRGCCWMMDLEGNLKGFSPKEESMARRFLENVLAPVSVRKVKENNTSVLIRALKLSWDHPKRWTTYSVPETGKYMPLTGRQQFVYGALAGQFNRHSFNTPKFKKIIHALKTGTIENLDRIKEFSTDGNLLAFKEEVEAKLIANKTFAGAILLKTPEFKRLLDLSIELQILKNPKIMKLTESQRFLDKLKDPSNQTRQNL